jgi:hypothetical protein
MADREFFVEGVQVLEEGTEEFFVEGVQVHEDQADAAATSSRRRRLICSGY